MKIVLAVNMVFPVDIINIELGFADATDEALAVDLLLLGSVHVSLGSKRVNNDTKEHVHDNDCDEEEVEEIEDPSEIVVNRLTIECIPQLRLSECFTYTTSSTESNIECCSEALGQSVAVHIEVVVLKIGPKVKKRQERRDEDERDHENHDIAQSLIILCENFDDFLKYFKSTHNIKKQERRVFVIKDRCYGADRVGNVFEMSTSSFLRSHIHDDASYDKKGLFAYHDEDFAHSASELRKLLSYEIYFGRWERHIILFTLLSTSSL